MNAARGFEAGAESAAAHVIPRVRHLLHELDAIASVELGDILDGWHAGTPVQADRLAKLRAYLVDEMSGYGMLSVAHAREVGVPLGRERADARRILSWIDKTIGA